MTFHLTPTQIPSVRKHESRHGSKETGSVSAPSNLKGLSNSLSGRQSSQFHQLEQRKYSMEILNNYRHKLDEKLDCFSGTESFKVSRDAQLHPWACAMFTDRNSLFALPDVDRPRLPHQWLNLLISRHEFVELEALVWLIARSLLFDIPSRNFSKKSLAESRIKIATFA